MTKIFLRANISVQDISQEVNDTKGLKQKRLAAHLSQVELANILGTVQSAISAWESGEKMPRASQLPALAEALHCSIDELFTPPEEESA